MGLNWRSLLFYAGIVLLLEISTCSAGARVPRTSARALAQRTGAAHYEERFEKVASSEESREHQLRKRASDEDFDYEVYQGVVGRPGIDFPILPRIPQTTFSCRTFGNGYFADLETECQVFHICDDGRKISFLCPNGTIFQQTELICDWWFKVNCPASPGHYAESAEMLSRAQGRKHQSTYNKKVENEFYSNGEGYSRSPFSNKNQYPIKKDNRKFEGSTDRRKDHKYSSDEVPSLENFDFEDISDNTQLGQDKQKVLSKVDSNDSEMQDVAESASFVGNNQRRNGYNYDSGGQKTYDDRKGYEKPKSDRGRQKYRGDSEKPLRGRNQNVDDGTEEFPRKNGRDDRHRGVTTSPRDRHSKKIESEGLTTAGLIHQKRPNAVGARERPSTHTTPRRLDNSRTTPYYTPTVPTIRATASPANGKAGSSQSSTTLVEPKEPTSTNLGKEHLDFGGFGGSPPQTQSSQTGKGEGAISDSAPGSISDRSKETPGITSGFAVSGPPAITIPPQDYSFDAQGKVPTASPAGTGIQGNDSKGYGYQIPSQKPQPGTASHDIASQRGSFGSPSIAIEESTTTSGHKVPLGTKDSGTPSGKPSLKFELGAKVPSISGTLGTGDDFHESPKKTKFGQGTKTPSEPDRGRAEGRSYKTPSDQDSVTGKKFGQSTTVAGEIGRVDTDGRPYESQAEGIANLGGVPEAKFTNALPEDSAISQGANISPNAAVTGSAKHDKKDGNFTGYSYQSPGGPTQSDRTASGDSKPQIPSDSLQRGSSANKSETPSKDSKDTFPEGDQAFSTPSPAASTEIPFYTSKQELPDSKGKQGTLIQSPAIPTPLVIGMRGTLPTDVAHKPGSSTPVITVNVLSDSTFSAGKLPVPSSGNVIPNSISGDSSHKPTTFKPFSSSSGPTYLPKEATTIGPSSYDSNEVTTNRPSSAGPTYLPKPTSPSPLSETVSEHVQEMIKTLNGLKKDLADNKLNGKTRVGLEIPPSSGPETLHSLAVYFAGEEGGAKTTTDKGETPATIHADISAVPLRNKTVQQYETLFGLSTTEKGAEPTLPPNFQPNIARSGTDLEAQDSKNLLGDAGGKPETRKIAQVFTNALSAYLEDPDSFRKVLTEVRPTEPPSTEENEVTTQSRTTNPYFNGGTAASYLPTVPTTVSPSTTTDDLEVLDFSDVTISSGQRGQTPFSESTTTDFPTTGRPGIKMLDRIPASVLAAARGEKQGRKLHINGGTTTDSNLIAVEINKGLGLSTVIPYQPEEDGGHEKHKPSFGVDISTASGLDSATTTQLPITFDLLPPIGSQTKDFGAPSSDILPPGYDDDEDTLQRAQSQSFVASRNRLGKEDQVKQGKPGTRMPGHYITRLMSDLSTTTEHPSSWFLDPLTINDGLMDGSKTTTASPYTYLPKVTSTTTETSPVHLDLSLGLNKIHLDDRKTDRLGKALPGIPEDLLPPENGMQRIANKVFGGLNESSADHLMNVMKKAEDNPTVRRLILLLIQTCGDDDFSKTVEQSRQALLNALIGMDENFALEDEIEVIKLRPKQIRRGKSIDSSDQNLLVSSTTEYPVTTFRRMVDVSAYSTTTGTPSTTDSSVSTTQNPLEETTRFEIRVEDPDDNTTTTGTPETDQINFSTTTKSGSSQEITSSYNIVDASGLPTVSPIDASSSARSGSRRKAKHLDNSLSQPSNFSHKSSDERALELLKSLYSLASKFGRR